MRFRKIYINSAYRDLNDRQSTSDFVINLREQQECGPNTKMICHEVSIANSFYPIEDNLNNRLYLTLGGILIGAPVYYFIVAPDKGSYVGSELATELQNKLNTATNGTDGNSDFFTCSYSLKTNNITISCNYISYFFIIHTDKELKTNYSFGIDYDRDYLNSINDILGNTTEKVNSTADPFVSGFVSFLPVKNIYIHCNELSNGNQLCSFGTSSIIKKVPVLTSFGNLIYDNELILNDANDVSMRSLRRLHFRFTDASGRVLNMNGTTSSFSLTFFEG